MGTRNRTAWRSMSAIAATSVLVVACAGPAAAPGSDAARIDAVSDLRSIVVAPDAPPAGMGHDATAEGAEVLSRVIMSTQVTELLPVLAQPGFVAGRYTEFSGESGALLSWAARFDSPESASGAYAMYLVEFASEQAYGLSASSKAGLGDEGACDEGDVVIDRATGATLREAICLWRVDDLVMAAGGPMPAPELRTIAEAMNARAAER